MSKHELPDGWPDPYALLRDPNWKENYPKLVLRGIYDIMKRKKKGKNRTAVAVNVVDKYLAGFNIIVYRLTMIDHPRLNISDIENGILNMQSLTKIGREREAEVVGKGGLSPKSVRYYGEQSRSAMAIDTDKKMDELTRMLATVRSVATERGLLVGEG